MFFYTLDLADPKAHASGWSGDGGCHPNCDCGRYVEVWNDVFMQYFKNAEGKFELMARQNVDTGMGLERMAMVLQGKKTVFETELFAPLIAEIETKSGKRYGADEPASRSMRIIADHLKTATFIIGDQRGVGPSNVDQGYIVRRLIRRAVRFGRQLEIPGLFTADIAAKVVAMYAESYPELARNRGRIMTELQAEEEKFGRTLERGMAEAMKLKENSWTVIPGATAFYLYESFGFPKELTEEVLGKTVNADEWDAEMKKHQDLSRAGSEQKFSGGMADHSEEIRPHAHRDASPARRVASGPRQSRRTARLEHHQRTSALRFLSRAEDDARTGQGSRVDREPPD